MRGERGERGGVEGKLKEGEGKGRREREKRRARRKEEGMEAGVAKGSLQRGSTKGVQFI